MVTRVELNNVRYFRRINQTKTNPTKKINVIDDISFNVEDGERLALIGSNGSGKTTLLRLIAGILIPDSGTVKVNGTSNSILDQGFGLDPSLSGLENARTRAIMFGLRKSELNEMVKWVGEFSGLNEKYHQPVKTYSQGMLTRLIFSLNTFNETDCLLIDESFGTADHTFHERASQRLNSMFAGARVIIYASHNRDFIIGQCTRAIYIDCGKIIDDGDVESVYNTYLSNVQG
jgi:ABC-type polysaccharide/polyol phosphate transport system ATPase subunit